MSSVVRVSFVEGVFANVFGCVLQVFGKRWYYL